MGRDVPGLGSDCVVFFEDDGLGVDSHILGGVVRFVDADETIGDLEHVVPQGDDDKLSVLGLLLNTIRHNVTRLKES